MLVSWPVSTRKADRLYSVPCGVCGQTRSLSDRRARAIRVEGPTVCRSCRRRPAPRVTDANRLWWLYRFDDKTIAELAVGLFGAGDPEAVASWRARLLGASPATLPA